MIWQCSRAVTTVRAKPFWNPLEASYMRLREAVVKRIKVIKFGVNDRVGKGIEVRADEATLTIMTIAWCGEKGNWVCKTKSRMRAKWVMVNEILCILASCFLSPMSNISVCPDCVSLFVDVMVLKQSNYSNCIWKVNMFTHSSKTFD